MSEIKPQVDLLSEPRRPHYYFAHRELWKLISEKPTFYQSMSIENLDRIFWGDWELVNIRETDALEEYSLEEIKVDIYQVIGYQTIVVSMPPPRAVAEAYFVAIVFMPMTDSINTHDDLTFRYFTLELGVNPFSGIQTVFCEWTDQCHHNFGPGPYPKIGAFLETIEHQLDKS